jgi:hypothetical protein
MVMLCRSTSACVRRVRIGVNTASECETASSAKGKKKGKKRISQDKRKEMEGEKRVHTEQGEGHGLGTEHVGLEMFALHLLVNR